jgi:hypothetical protein
MNDIRNKPQLLSGWYPIEDGAWRWMAKRAEVTLQTPTNTGLAFDMQLYFPPDHMQRAGGPVTLTVRINGRPLGEETYSEPGGYRFTKPVPEHLLAFPRSQVTIRMNRAIPPSSSDLRELGTVVQALGFLEGK